MWLATRWLRIAQLRTVLSVLFVPFVVSVVFVLFVVSVLFSARDARLRCAGFVQAAVPPSKKSLFNTLVGT